MNKHGMGSGAENDEDMLSFELSDETLEMAASTATGAAVSFPGAPTVSVLVVCCSVEDNR